MEINNQVYNVQQKPYYVPIPTTVQQSYAMPNYPISYQNPIANQVIQNNALANINTKSFVEFPSIKLPASNLTAKVYQLSNGQKVFIVPKKGPTTIRSFFKVGSFNEPDHLRGISHYIEHNLFNGSKNLKPNEFVEKVSEMGGRYNASTGFLTTDYYIKTPLHLKNDFNKALDIHADMLKNPTFTQETLDKEKGPVTSEIQMLEDDPYNKSVNTAIKNLFNVKTDSSDLIGGTVNNIENLTREDVINYYNTWYTPDNMTTVIVGDVNPNQAINMINQKFNTEKVPSEKPMPKEYENLSNPIPQTVRKDIISSSIESPLLTMALVGPKNADIKEGIVSDALIVALSGHENARLTKALEKFDTTPTLSKEVIGTKYDDNQSIILQTQFKEGQEEEGLKQIYSTMFELSQKPLSQKELLIVKNKLKDDFSNIAESSMALSTVIGRTLMYKGNLNGYINAEAMINSITATDIQNLAKKYIDLNKASIVMAHPKKNSKQISFGSKSITNFKGNEYLKNDVVEYDLQNNMRLALNDNHYTQRSCSEISITSNQIPQTKAGVPELLYIMMNEGTKNYTKEQMQEIFDIESIRNGLNVSSYSISVNTDCTKENTPLALKMAKELLYNPSFTNEKLEKAKSKVKLKYLEAAKNPYNRAIEKLYPNHVYGHSPRKVLEEVDNITLNDVVDFYNKIITQGQTKAVITAPVSSTPMLYQNIINELSLAPLSNKKFNPIETVQTPELQENSVITQAEERNQANIVQMFKINESGNIKDKAALLIMNRILGGNSHSRLFMDLRETQKLAYAVSSDYSSDGRAGEITLSIKTTTEDKKNNLQHFENIQKSLNGFKKHINKMITEPVSQKELEMAKLGLKSSLIFGSESTFSRNQMISGGYNSFYGANYSEELLKAIDDLSAQDIQNAARIYLTKPSVTSILASENTIKYNENYLKSLGTLEKY